jgi:hypothetical protein
VLALDEQLGALLEAIESGTPRVVTSAYLDPERVASS